MSWTVSTATTPGSLTAALVSMPVMRACATGLRTNVTRAAPVEFRRPQVVDVDPAGGQQARILRPYHPGAQDAHVSLRSSVPFQGSASEPTPE